MEKEDKGERETISLPVELFGRFKAIQGLTAPGTTNVSFIRLMLDSYEGNPNCPECGQRLKRQVCSCKATEVL
jgi:hypothetical protein